MGIHRRLMDSIFPGLGGAAERGAEVVTELVNPTKPTTPALPSEEEIRLQAARAATEERRRRLRVRGRARNIFLGETDSAAPVARATLLGG